MNGKSNKQHEERAVRDAQNLVAYLAKSGKELDDETLSAELLSYPKPCFINLGTGVDVKSCAMVTSMSSTPVTEPLMASGVMPVISYSPHSSVVAENCGPASVLRVTVAPRTGLPVNMS